MALNNQLFSFVEDQEFIELVTQLEPLYFIPSRMYFSETMLPEVYNELRATVMKELAAAHHVLFTIDNSHSNDSFLSMMHIRLLTVSQVSSVCYTAIIFLVIIRALILQLILNLAFKLEHF